MKGDAFMSGVFDEKRMTKFLDRYIPDGEVLRAGIHGIGLETEVRQVFGNCSPVGEEIVPRENGGLLEVSKRKYSNYDVYIGITQRYLILSECDIYKHLYDFNENPDPAGTVVEEVSGCIPLDYVGTCFLLSEISRCVVKKGWMGSVKCQITMKNGSQLKLMLPKRGGIGGGMPNHTKYREEIIACLSNLNCAHA